MSDRKYNSPQAVLREFAREANNMAFHLEEDVARLTEQAKAKADEAANLRFQAKKAMEAADILENRHDR